MKGIILAGGKGSRLYPMTKAVSKPLVPIYDKPMVYYPLTVLLQAGIRDIMLITAPADVEAYRRLLGDGSHMGIRISYGIQYVPRGIADAFLIAEEFIGEDRCCLILGDNLFYGRNLERLLGAATERPEGATVFGYPVKNPSDFGVVEFDENNRAVSLEEKPKEPKSEYAVPGLYFYDHNAVTYAKRITPSARGELEITALNAMYLEKGTLHVELMGKGIAWLDTGTPDGMLSAAQYVAAVQNRQGEYIGCPEEIAWKRGFIDEDQLTALGNDMKMTEYGQYLLGLKK